MSVKEKKVSIILIHYNQKEYIKGALSSIFKQKYKNISLIIADDASKDFDLDDIKKFINKQNKKKYEVRYSINKENLGTVKNLNNALNFVTGDYVLIFAADDELYDENVISKMVEFYNKQDKDVSIVFGQCLMMDKNLKQIKEKYIKVSEADRFNEMTSFEQYKLLSTNCFAAMGACMLNVKMLKDNKFDERLRYIEDWTYFIKTTLSNHRMKYLDYNCLIHRDGGISHTTTVTKTKIDFFKDLLKLSEFYVFPNFKAFGEVDKEYIVKRYVENRDYVISNGYKYDDSNYSKLKKDNILFFCKRKLKQILMEFRPRIKKLLKIGIVLLLFTALLLFLYKILINALSFFLG